MKLSKKIKNLVFEGGGAKGLAYLGACRYLNELGLYQNIKRVGGTSAGAINALIVGLNYSVEESKAILTNMDLNGFLDGSPTHLEDIARLVKNYGLYKGDHFYTWIGKVIERKTGNHEATFADIEKVKYQNGFLDMFFVATNLSTGMSERYSYATAPNMMLKDAVRRSMSIPLFFEAIHNDQNEVIVDGGLLDNYPVRLFDKKMYCDDELDFEDLMIPDYYEKKNLKIEDKEQCLTINSQTLGFRLDTSEKIELLQNKAIGRHKISNIIDYIKNLVDVLMDSQQDHTHLNSNDWMRTIYVDCGDIGFLDFDISSDQKNWLIEMGYNYTKQYFEWRDLYSEGRFSEAHEIRPREEGANESIVNIDLLVSDTNDLLR